MLTESIIRHHILKIDKIWRPNGLKSCQSSEYDDGTYILGQIDCLSQEPYFYDVLRLFGFFDHLPLSFSALVNWCIVL